MFNGLVPALRPAAQALYDEARRRGWRPNVTSTRRSSQQQARLYRRYLAGQSPFPAAPPGQSLHEYGLAFDMVVTPRERWADLGRIWKSWGGAWFEHDPVHFQVRR